MSKRKSKSGKLETVNGVLVWRTDGAPLPNRDFVKEAREERIASLIRMDGVRVTSQKNGK